MRDSKHSQPVESLIREYYRDILRYCNAKLQDDSYVAEDCTQEVFLVLYEKVNTLDMSKDIRPWLYAVADRKIKAYARKNQPMLNLEAIPEQEQMIDFNFDGNNILDVLDEEERRLIKDYFEGESKIKLAKLYGISLPNLYVRVSRIKNKLRKYLDE